MDCALAYTNYVYRVTEQMFDRIQNGLSHIHCRFAELHATDSEANKERGRRAETRVRDHSHVLSEQELFAHRSLRSQSRGLHKQRQLQQSPVATRSRTALLRRLFEQRGISDR